MWASLTTSMNYYAFATVYNSCGHRTLYRASETNYTKKWIEPKNTVMKEEPLPPAMWKMFRFGSDTWNLESPPQITLKGAMPTEILVHVKLYSEGHPTVLGFGSNNGQG